MSAGSKFKLAVFAVLALAVAGLILGVANWAQPRSSSSVLPDGTVVELLRVSYGKKHVYYPGSSWDRLLALMSSILPRQFSPKAPLQLASTNDSLCCWLRIRPANPSQRPYLEWTVTEADGLNCGGSGSTTSRSLSNTEEIAGVLFQSFPRRSDRLLLQSLQYDNQVGQHRAVVSFAIRNPSPRRFPEWTAPLPPATARDGDIEFTLTRAVGGVKRNSEFRRDETGKSVRIWQRATNVADAATLLAFRPTRGGQVLTNWQPVNVWAWDVTGNLAKSSSWSSDTQDDEALMIYQWGLWPTEAAWKLRVQFSRLSEFAPEERWDVAGFSTTNLMPKSKWWGLNQAARSALAVRTTNLLGAELSILPLFTSEQGGNPPQRVELSVMVKPGSADYRLTLVRITDEHGMPVKRSGTSWSDGNYEFSLEDLGGVQSLNISLAYHRSRFGEYLVKPTLAK